MGTRPRRYGAALLGVAIALVAQRAIGQSDPRSRAIVEVAATGSTATTSALEIVVRELLARQPVVLRWSRVSGFDPRDVLARHSDVSGVIARVWADLSDREHAHVYVANATSERFLVRSVPLEEGDEEVVREALAHIIESAVDALVSGADIGVTRDVAAQEIEARSLHRSAPEALPRPCGARTDLAAYYQLSVLGSGPNLAQQQGIFASVTGSCIRRILPVLIVSAQYLAPLSWDADPVSIQIEGLGLRLAGAINVRLSERVSVRPTVGVGADFWNVEPTAAPGSGATAAPSYWTSLPIVTAALALQFRLAGPVFILVAAACDIDASGRYFSIATSTGPITEIVPWRVRPAALVAVSLPIESR